MAAGLLIVTEAGGFCSDMHGGPASLRGPHLLADNDHIHGQMIEMFSDIFAGRPRFALPEVQG
jgi:myo-inositol-1(or 4)-monophosphatase